MSDLFLGIEIGGTKLQLAVGAADGSEFVELVRHDVNGARGASGILEQIESTAQRLVSKYSTSLKGIGVGFGGPVDAATGRVVKSHQVGGWDNVPLGAWCETTFGLPTAVGNDCDCAALAEAKFGAGKKCGAVFYVTVGTGIGGGFVINGQLHGAGRPAVAEIGHLRPGLQAINPEDTVESLASGPGIAAAARLRLAGHDVLPFIPPRRVQHEMDATYEAELRQRCRGQVNDVTAKTIAQAAGDGNELAREILDHAMQALGWAIAQVITLLAPEVIVVGGGVSLIGDALFFEPLRRHVASYVFQPLANSYRIEPAALGEAVVVHGALAIARNRSRSSKKRG